MREIVAVAALLLGACAATPPGPAKPAAPAPLASEFVQGQRLRAERLQDFTSRGSAELRWKDERGDHFEQAQVEIAWRAGGERMALRADKLGERLAWAGSDASRWWVFEPRSEPSRLTVGARGTVPRGSAVPFAGPESVIELLAARAWPDDAKVTRVEGGGALVQWSLAKPIGAWSRTRVQVDSPGAVPRRVELLDVTDSPVASSELSRPLSVRIDTLPPGAWPDVAGTVRLRMAGDEGATWDLFLDAPSADPERLKERMFDLEVLKEVMRPQQVVEGGAKGPR